MGRPPYAAAVRLCLYWLSCEADISGRCALRGIQGLDEEPLVLALDVIYSLILDDSDGPRHEARARVDLALERPFDETEALEYDREHWGTSPDALAEAARKDAMFGDVSYE